MEAEVNIDYCRERGINLFRRKSGGGCVYSDSGNIMLSYISDRTDVSSTFDLFLDKLANCLSRRVSELEDSLISAYGIDSILARAQFFRDNVALCMTEVRAAADELETIVASKYWPYPTYSDLLFNV